MSDIIIEDPDDLKYAVRDMQWAKRIAECLEKHYPGYLWAVNANSKGGIATVQSMALSGEWGFNLHLKDIGPQNKEVVRAGGEILERYSMNRGQFQEDQYLQKQRDFAGRLVVDTL